MTENDIKKYSVILGEGSGALFQPADSDKTYVLSARHVFYDEIKDERYAKAFRILFTIIEKQNEEIEFLKAENQKLRDEINLLKGEKAKPKIRGSKKNEDISSEKERRNTGKIA